MMMRKCVSSHHQCKPISGRLGPIYLLFNIGKPISGLDTFLIYKEIDSRNCLYFFKPQEYIEFPIISKLLAATFSMILSRI